MKNHESDSTKTLTIQKTDHTFNVMDENYKELSESDDISKQEKKKNDDNYFAKIKIKSPNKNDNMLNNYRTTLRPKKKIKRLHVFARPVCFRGKL